MAVEDKTVLIVGGGLAGLTTALDLVEAGVQAAVVERDEACGGHAAKLVCKALAACQACNGCLVPPRLAKALTHPGVQVYPRSRLTAVAREGDHFALTVRQALPEAGTERDLTLAGQAVVLATGFQPYPAEAKPRLGWGRVPNVVTALELESSWRRQGRVVRPSDEAPPRRVAFIQCVGSRERTGHNYCSRVCCGYALRMGRALRHRFGTEVSVFYMDLQTFGHSFQETLTQARSELELIRCLPSDVQAGPGGQVLVQYQAEEGQPFTLRPFDLVVLSVGLTPNPDNQALAELLGVELDRHGFFKSAGPDRACAASPAGPGIFLAGTTLRPMDLAEVVAQAGRTAQEVVSYLEEVDHGRRD